MSSSTPPRALTPTVPVDDVPRPDPTSPVAPSREDALVASASEVVGGPLGRHAVIGGLGGALATLLTVLPLLVGAGVVERAHCLQQGWSTPDHFWHACYSDIPIVYQSAGLSDGVGPFSAGNHVGLPLPTAVLSWVLASVVPGDGFLGVAGSTTNQARWYFALWAVAIAALLAGLGAGLVRGQARHPWRALHLASPALPFLALVSFEVVPVALTGAGLLAWGRGRRVLAGALLALACLARPWVVFALVAILLLGVRTGRLRDGAVTGVVALGTAAVLLIGAACAGFDLSVYTSWWSAASGFGSVWFLGSLAGLSWAPGLLALVGCSGWVLALVAGTYLALASRRRPRLGELVLVMTTVAILFGKAMPVQSGLWLVLLMALVGVSWREHVVWASVEVAYFVAVWLHIAAASDPNRGLPAGWYSVFVVVRILAWVWILVSVWRRAVARPVATALATTPPGDEAPPVDASAPPGGVRPPVLQVVEEDDLAGRFAACPDRTIVSFV